MSGTHALDRSLGHLNWEHVRQRTVEQSRAFGSGVLGIVARGINKFEIGMAAHSLRHDELGTLALRQYHERGIDPLFARSVEARLTKD